MFGGSAEQRMALATAVSRRYSATSKYTLMATQYVEMQQCKVRECYPVVLAPEVPVAMGRDH